MSYEDIEEARIKRAAKDATKGKGKCGENVSKAFVGLHRLPFITRCDRGCLVFTGIY